MEQVVATPRYVDRREQSRSMVSDHLGNLHVLDLLEQCFHLRFEEVIDEFKEVQEQEERGERNAQS
ncbi:hypothetical protein ABZ747_13170 [Kitasatospora cineracea]|uniref:hypothetical protein n=1 Tax=Kitasatospora cineracea TaxID=88074 RepID=UPI0033FD748B